MSDILIFDKVFLTLGTTPILKDFDMTLGAGETKVIMGPSGLGKTSLLRLAAGLLKPNAGTVTTAAKRISMQFQEPRLLPWLTAAENVNLVLSDSKKTLDKSLEYLSLVELADAARLYPDELSGGMAQRVALARTLAYGGDLILLDEPFRGLDQELKLRMIEVVKKHTQNAALLLVTHDLEVADAFGGADLTFPLIEKA